MTILFKKNLQNTNLHIYFKNIQKFAHNEDQT